MHEGFASVCVHYVGAWYWRKSEGMRFLRAGVADGYEPPCGCWALILGPL